MLSKLLADLKKLKNRQRAKILQRFFKTGKGEYAEGDIFLGIAVPIQRKLAKKYKDLTLSQIQKLLNSKIHEHRLTGLFILVNKYEKSNQNQKNKIFNFYLKNLKNINNWDLVDLSAPNIIGNHLLDKNKSLLYKLAISKNLWEKRISILSTFEFIKNHQFQNTLKISKILIADKHNLIHKAVGWMLRELGKKDLNSLLSFLDQHHKQMPRTTLRYAIEKLDQNKRKFYLGK